MTVRRAAELDHNIRHLGDVAEGIEKSIRSTAGAATKQLGTEIDRITSSEGGVLSVAVERELGRIVEELDVAFDADSKASVIGRLAEVVEKVSTSNLEEVRRPVSRLVDPSIPDGPGGRLRAEVIREVTSVREAVQEISESLAVTRAVAAEADRGTSKGLTFEESVGAELVTLATPTGDLVERVGNEKGILGSEVGDYIVEIIPPSGNGRIAVECKDRKSFSTAKARAEVDAAVDNREADSGVIVFSGDTRVTNGAPMVKLASGRYAVVFDKNERDSLALGVAMSAARIDAMSYGTAADDIDVDALCGQLDEAMNLLNKVTVVKQDLGAAAGSIDKAKRHTDELKEALRSKLEEINDMLRS